MSIPVHRVGALRQRTLALLAAVAAVAEERAASEATAGKAHLALALAVQEAQLQERMALMVETEEMPARAAEAAVPTDTRLRQRYPQLMRPEAMVAEVEIAPVAEAVAEPAPMVQVFQEQA